MIRPLHPDDALSLYELFREPGLLSCGYFNPAGEFATYQQYVDKPAADQHRLVAISDERLVGVGILEALSRSRLLHMGRIRVLLPDDSAVGKSVADLLHTLIDLADNWLNLRRLEVDIPARAPAIKTMLGQAGFEVEGLFRKAFKVGDVVCDQIAMARLRGFAGKEGKHRPPISFPDRTASDAVACDVLIRPMQAEDVEDLYQIFRAPENCRTTLQLPSQELWLTRQRVLEPLASMKRLVAQCNGRVVGMISLNPRHTLCQAHVGGIGMMVHPDYWGQGIGSRLMEAILELAIRELDLTRIELQVHTDNTPAIRLYKKFGFVVEATKRFQNYGPGGWADTYAMARIIE